jgi:uncharacterized protein with FMN-binding domain
VRGVRRIVLWGMSTVTVLVLLFGYHTSLSSTSGRSSAVGPPPVQGGADAPGSGSAPSATPSPAPSSAGPPAPTTGGAAKSGTVTGDSADTRWGPVQVQLTIAAGKITKVAVIDYPQNNGRDREINARALPILVQETLKAQSASIDMVSGATVTSEGYLTSLQSALDAAGI